MEAEVWQITGSNRSPALGAQIRMPPRGQCPRQYKDLSLVAERWDRGHAIGVTALPIVGPGGVS